MPNRNAPFGLKPIRHMSGGSISPSKKRIANAYATAIYSGDPVKAAADGTIQLAAAGDRLLGVFAGCNWVDVDGTPRFSPYWPASTATMASAGAEALVYDDPDIVFEIQSAGTPGITHIGNLADHVAGTGSPVTGRSAATLSGTMATGAAGFRILEFVPAPDNEIGQYARLEVHIYEHELSVFDAGTPGV